MQAPQAQMADCAPSAFQEHTSLTGAVPIALTARQIRTHPWAVSWPPTARVMLDSLRVRTGCARSAPPASTKQFRGLHCVMPARQIPSHHCRARPQLHARVTLDGQGPMEKHAQRVQTGSGLLWVTHVQCVHSGGWRGVLPKERVEPRHIGIMRGVSVIWIISTQGLRLCKEWRSNFKH